MTFPNLSIRAGAKAKAVLANEGLSLDKVRVLAGASGGAKWLVLSKLDRLLAQYLQQRILPLQCIGSSIGSWRMAALAQRDAATAIERFEHAYVNQRYPHKPSAADISDKTASILESYLSADAIDEVINHPAMRLAIIAARVRGMQSTQKWSLPLGLNVLGAAAANSVKREWLGGFFERAIFSSENFNQQVFNSDTFPTDWIPLARNNFKQALTASGSIPFLMEGVWDVAGAKPGFYLDGGVLDYHLDLPYQVADDELVLMLHFYPDITPGWFDKSLPWRHGHAKQLENVVVISPSAEFVQQLPGGQIPDRRDFKTFFQQDDERIRRWQSVLISCDLMAGDFEEVLSAATLNVDSL